MEGASSSADSMSLGAREPLALLGVRLMERPCTSLLTLGGKTDDSHPEQEPRRPGSRDVAGRLHGADVAAPDLLALEPSTGAGRPGSAAPQPPAERGDP